MPWERRASARDEKIPWLGLLVIDEEEERDAKSSVVNLKDLKTKLKITTLEPGQSDEDKIAVLTIRKSLLQEILPE